MYVPAAEVATVGIVHGFGTMVQRDYWHLRQQPLPAPHSGRGAIAKLAQELAEGSDDAAAYALNRWMKVQLCSHSSERVLKMGVMGSA